MENNSQVFMNPYTDFGFKKLFGTAPNKDLPKFKKKENELVTMQDKWLFVLKNLCYLLTQPTELQEKVFVKFFEEARIGLFNEEQQFAYMVSQKHYWDNHNTLAYSFEKGKKEGDVQARQEMAEKMKAAGIDKKTILEVTGIKSDSEV